MNNLFNECTSLKSLPDISKWNVEKIANISEMFKCCSSLNSLPDISKWNINESANITSIFYGLPEKLSLPDINRRKKTISKSFVDQEISSDIEKNISISSTERYIYKKLSNKRFSNYIVFKLIYIIDKNVNKLKIVNKHFVDKNRGKCKIIYRNKILPMQSELVIQDITIKYLKIKLICYCNISSISDITKRNKNLYSFNEYKNYKNKINSIFKFNPEASIIFRAVYRIEKGIKKIKIFGDIFVDNNKDKIYA